MSKRKSTTAGQHSFAQVPSANIERSSFNRSCGLKTTFDAGLLIPIFVDEALPGDTMALRMATFGRLATPLHPIMDNLYMDFHFFAVPVRLLWDNWQKFNGEQTDPEDSTDFLVPEIQITDTAISASSISDYLGIPTSGKEFNFSALWHRAYNLIWNEWFRDENLQDSVITNTGDGPDDIADYQLLRRGKRHDYVTSCLPWPQKGPAVGLPLGETAPVIPDPWAELPPASGNFFAIPQFLGIEARHHLHPVAQDLTAKYYDGDPLVYGSFGVLGANYTVDENEQMEWKDNTGLKVDLTAATAATINQLRQAFQIQRLYERDARGGSRYTEIIRSHFGVNSPDQRLQRPEFLGGGTSNVNVNPVAQTSSTDGTSPQANLAAFGTQSSSGIGFSKSFTEHCVILGFASVRADLNYQQGLNRQFSRRTRWDYYWPALAHLGEQAVLNKEVHTVGSDTDRNDMVFGYQERYAEYRYKPSMITGQMRSSFAQSLDTWHLAQDFAGGVPLLAADFIEENPPIDRVIAVPTEPHFLFDAYFSYRCARPMPTYSVPGQIDHF